MEKRISDEELCKIGREYIKKFNRGYPRKIGGRETAEETYEKMKKAIETGIPAEPYKIDIPPGAYV